MNDSEVLKYDLIHVCGYCAYGLFFSFCALSSLFVNHYVTPMSSRQNLNKFYIPIRARGASRLHFIEAEVYLWQVYLEALMFMFM